eukprot:9797759-Ditylum_brightwellii.AAC.1
MINNDIIVPETMPDTPTSKAPTIRRSTCAVVHRKLHLFLSILVHFISIQPKPQCPILKTKVDRMLDLDISSVKFWAINTDAQAQGHSKSKGVTILTISASAVRGLVAGGNPELRHLAAKESCKDITPVVTGSDLCFVTSGMGDDTGSGAAPVVSEVAKESDALTVVIVTKSFTYEGRRQMRQATKVVD